MGKSMTFIETEVGSAIVDGAEKLLTHLVRKESGARTMAYGDFATWIRTNFGVKMVSNGKQMDEILEAISRRSHAQHGFMLSAVVGNTARKENEPIHPPGALFFELAAALELEVVDRTMFVIKQRGAARKALRLT
jgi:hypothetical protein